MEGISVPQWFPRPVMALIAASVAAFSVCLISLPAYAEPVAVSQAPSATSARASEWWLEGLHVTTAWLASQGSGVKVAVLSDGVDTSQPDLGDSVTSAPAPSGAPHATGAFFGEQGTGIASLIAGHGHGQGDGTGIIGIAPAARILSVPVTLPADDPMLGSSSVASAIPDAIAAGIRYAVQHKASVIDLPIDPGQPDASGTGGNTAAGNGSPAELAAVNYALSHNVVLVAPAGDDQTTTRGTNFPAAYHGVIAVGAFNSSFIKAPFSIHASYVTVTAPGEGVTAAANTGGYQVMNSTAAASAIVSGIVALIRSRYPQLSVSQVRTVLTTSTRFRAACGLACGSGYGTVDAGRALVTAAQIAAGPGHRAGTGAQQVVAPGTIAATPSVGSLEPGIVRSAAISGGLLAFLLLLVWWYSLTGRRRARRQAATVAEWSKRPAQSRYPQAQPVADPFAGYLASPPAPILDGAAAKSSPPVWDEAAPGAPPAIRSVSRPVSPRPAVQGAPPWEPAVPPAGEMPWSAASTPQPAAAEPRLAGASTPQPAAAEPPWSAASTPQPAAAEPPWSAASTPQPAAAEPPWTITSAPQSARELRWSATVAPRPASADPPWVSASALPSATPPATPRPALSPRSAPPALPPGSGGSPVPAFPSASGNSAPLGPAGDGRGTADPGPLAAVPKRPARPSKLAPWDASDGSVASETSWPTATGHPSAVDRPRLADRPWLLGGASADEGWPADGRGAADSGGWPGSQAPGATSAQAGSSAAGWNAASAPDDPGSASSVTASGLPRRQPRASATAQSSPSGSLWERAVGRQHDQAGAVRGRHQHRDELTASDGPADSPVGDVPDQRGPRRRLNYDWRRAASTDNREGPPTE
jgi:subtilisin family serine protease